MDVTGLLGHPGGLFVFVWAAGSCCSGRLRPWRPGRSAQGGRRSMGGRQTWLRVRWQPYPLFDLTDSCLVQTQMLVNKILKFVVSHS